MPLHIDVLCGHYNAGIVANDRAILADRKYLKREGPLNFYTLSRTHNYHFKLYAALFLGQYRPALEAANELIATIPEALLRVTTAMLHYAKGVAHAAGAQIAAAMLQGEVGERGHHDAAPYQSPRPTKSCS
jgi:hypothetical protein